MRNTSPALQTFAISDAPAEMKALMARVPAGEPLALSDDVEIVDLKHLLTHDTPDALLLRVNGESMVPEIGDGDWIMVSRSLEPSMGDIVVASVNGEQTLKRLRRSDLKGQVGLYLVPTNGGLTARKVHAGDDFKVLAVVTRIILDPRKRGM